MASGIATLSPSTGNGATNIAPFPWANKRCGHDCDCREIKNSQAQPGKQTDRPIHSKRRPGATHQPVNLTALMPFEEERLCSSGPACPSSQHSLQSRRRTTAMPTHSDSVGCGDCQSDDEQWEKHSDNGAPPATNQGCSIPGCSGCNHSAQPSDASDAATIDVFKQIEALCDREQAEHPDSVIASIMQFNQQRLEKASRGDVLFSRLTKRNIELTQARKFLNLTEVELIGFIGWGEGCIGQLTHGNGSSAVEGFLYRQNGTTCYQRLGSSLGIFNQLTPAQQQSNESIAGPFASKFAQIIEIKAPDGRDIHQVYSCNPKNPSKVTPKNLNDMYPNGYGILQSKKAAKYLLEFHDWFHDTLEQNREFKTWWHSNLTKFQHNQNDKSIDANFLKIKSVHDPLHDTATKERLAALANNQGSVFTHSVGIGEDFSEQLATLSKSLVEKNKHAFLGL